MVQGTGASVRALGRIGCPYQVTFINLIYKWNGRPRNSSRLLPISILGENLRPEYRRILEQDSVGQF